MQTRCGYVKLFSLISAPVLLFQLAACGGRGTNSANDSFPIVVFSDIHFNPFYAPSLFEALDSSDAGQWESIFKTSKISAPPLWGSDTNYPLLLFIEWAVNADIDGGSIFVISEQLSCKCFT